MRAIRMAAITAVILAGNASPCAFATRPTDFNGDGYDDLAIGVPGENVGPIVDAGAVNVLYGSPAGVAVQHDQFWHQNRPGVLDDAETGDSFGSILSMGDFNGDGMTDLAIGIFGEDLPGATDAGAVAIFYGSPAGLSAAGNQFWSQAVVGVDGVAEAFDMFGSALASGDFNSDGFDDLVVGVPLESVDGIDEAGAVNVLYGSPAGLVAAGSQFWNQNTPGIEDEAERGPGSEVGERFGAKVLTGDFNGDGFADLVIGVRGEDLDDVDVVDGGAFHVLFGGAGGLSAVGNQFFTRDTPDLPDVPGDATIFSMFGTSFGAGDFNGDGTDDLAVSMTDRHESGPYTVASGRVVIVYGGVAGLSATGSQLWSQDSEGVNSSTESADRFGYRLTAGDFDDDGHDDLAIGVPFESFPVTVNFPYRVKHCGAAHVLYGSNSGLSAQNTQFWHENLPGVPNKCENGDHFGNAVTVGDYDGDGTADLAVGLRLEGILNASPLASRAGAVIVLYGSSQRLTAAGSQIWHQNRPGVADACEARDRFGTLGR